MITNDHEMAGLVGSMDGCYGFDSRIPITFPAPNSSEIPPSLGFAQSVVCPSGMVEEWRQDAQLVTTRPLILHLCRDGNGQWFAYLRWNWKKGFHPSEEMQLDPSFWDWVTIARQLGSIVSARVCICFWKTGEVILLKKSPLVPTGEVLLLNGNWSANPKKDETSRLVRAFVTDESFRIAWYADQIERCLYAALDSGEIRPVPNLRSPGKSKLKDPMTIAANVPLAAVRMEHYIVNEQGEYDDLFHDSRCPVFTDSD